MLFYCISGDLGMLPRPLTARVNAKMHTVFSLIEAGSQIQAGSLTEAGGSKG